MEEDAEAGGCSVAPLLAGLANSRLSLLEASRMGRMGGEADTAGAGDDRGANEAGVDVSESFLLDANDDAEEEFVVDGICRVGLALGLRTEDEAETEERRELLDPGTAEADTVPVAAGAGAGTVGKVAAAAEDPFALLCMEAVARGGVATAGIVLRVCEAAWSVPAAVAGAGEVDGRPKTAVGGAILTLAAAALDAGGRGVATADAVNAATEGAAAVMGTGGEAVAGANEVGEDTGEAEATAVGEEVGRRALAAGLSAILARSAASSAIRAAAAASLARSERAVMRALLLLLAAEGEATDEAAVGVGLRGDCCEAAAVAVGLAAGEAIPLQSALQRHDVKLWSKERSIT